MIIDNSQKYNVLTVLNQLCLITFVKYSLSDRSELSFSLFLSLCLPESPTFLDETCFHHAGIINSLCKQPQTIEVIGKNNLDRLISVEKISTEIDFISFKSPQFYTTKNNI